MPRRLFLFSALFILLTSVSVLMIKNLDRFYQSENLGAKMLIPRQSNQPGKCAPPNYIFPKKAQISDELLPDKVKDSFKNTIAITVCFRLNNQRISFPMEPIETGGTGFMFQSGLFISARHIFLATITYLNKRGYPFFIDKNGLPKSDYYQYIFYGTASIDGQPVNFPLELIAMGNLHRHRDLAVFRAGNPPSQLTPLEFGPPANLGNIVYSGGRVPLFKQPDDINPTQKQVLLDFVNFNFKGLVTEILTELPENTYSDLKKIYRLRTQLEPGFSGGPVFDTNGKVIGMTVSSSPGLSFGYAISAEDQEIFIKELKSKGKIPKK